MSNRPSGAPLIGVEQTPGSVKLTDFIHPKRAVYILGSESAGLAHYICETCQEVVHIPGERSLNVAVAGSIVLYDRISRKAST